MTEDVKPHKSIAAALVAAQAEMGPALRVANNPHLNKKYADLASVMGACMDALHNHGICVIQPSGQDEHGHYVETVLLHTSGEKLACRVPMIFGKNDMQGYGSAMTYARRYGLMAMAGVAPEDDDGEGAKGNGPPSNNRSDKTDKTDKTPGIDPDRPSAATIAGAVSLMENAVSLNDLKRKWEKSLPLALQRVKEIADAKERRKTQLAAGDGGQSGPIFDDEVPY